jgi:lysophospholipase L1-like esterase
LDKQTSSPARIATTALSALLVAYLVWEIYWYRQVGLAVIKWHTHLMVYVYLWLLVWYIFRGRIRNGLLLCSAVFFALFITEGLLQVSGLYMTYLERTSGQYESPYTPVERNYYHLWPLTHEHWIRKPEYAYWRPTNSLGFADHDWPRQTHGRRILALGDSFTEGDGAPFDSSYVAILQSELRASGDSIYVMNAGTCGSDPFNNYMNLRDRLIMYHPDLVIQSIGSADMLTDILLRGGMERFQRDGTVRYRSAPWWEPLYAVSYISRIFFTYVGYDELLRKKGISTAENDRITKSASDLFTTYADLCAKHGIKLYIIIHPEKGEVLDNKYHYDFRQIQPFATDTSITVVDLLPHYRAYIDSTHTSASDYYWLHDGHHNAKGYRMMAETTLESIRPYLFNANFTPGQ